MRNIDGIAKSIHDVEQRPPKLRASGQAMNVNQDNFRPRRP